MTEPLSIKRDGTWFVLPYGQPVTNVDGIQASYDTVQVWDVEEREAFGLFRPEPAPAPPGGKVETGRTLNDEDGKPVWAVTYADAPVPSLSTLKATKSAAVDAERDARLVAGFTVPAAASTALAGQVLQTRNAEDRLNWLVSESAYRDAVAAGQGEAVAAQFRNAANVTTTVAISEGLVVLKAMKAWGSAVMARSWALKDAIMAAADPASVEAVDITAGWPA